MVSALMEAGNLKITVKYAKTENNCLAALYFTAFHKETMKIFLALLSIAVYNNIVK